MSFHLISKYILEGSRLPFIIEIKTGITTIVKSVFTDLFDLFCPVITFSKTLVNNLTIYMLTIIFNYTRSTSHVNKMSLPIIL